MIDNSIKQQMDSIKALPQQQLQQVVNASSAQQPLGEGKDAVGHVVPDYDKLFLRVAKPTADNPEFDDITKLRDPNGKYTKGLKIIPIRYEGANAHLEDDVNLGIPRAVIVPENHRLAERTSISPLTALAKESAVPLWLLNRCSGGRPSQALGYSNSLDKLSHPLECGGGRERLAELKKNRKELREYKQNLNEQTTIYSDFLEFAKHAQHVSENPQYRSERLNKAIQLLGDTKRIKYTRDDYPETLRETSQTAFSHSYDEFKSAYIDGIKKLGEMSPEAYDNAVASLQHVHTANRDTHLDFQHGGNTLIDTKLNRIQFVDLDFSGNRTKGSLDDLLEIVLGKDLNAPWKLIVAQQDRQELQPHLQKVVDNINSAGKMHGLDWLPESSGGKRSQVSLLREHFSLR